MEARFLLTGTTERHVSPWHGHWICEGFNVQFSCLEYKSETWICSFFLNRTQVYHHEAQTVERVNPYNQKTKGKEENRHGIKLKAFFSLKLIKTYFSENKTHFNKTVCFAL